MHDVVHAQETSTNIVKFKPTIEALPTIASDSGEDISCVQLIFMASLFLYHKTHMALITLVVLSCDIFGTWPMLLQTVNACLGSAWLLKNMDLLRWIGDVNVDMKDLSKEEQQLLKKGIQEIQQMMMKIMGESNDLTQKFKDAIDKYQFVSKQSSVTL